MGYVTTNKGCSLEPLLSLCVQSMIHAAQLAHTLLTLLPSENALQLVNLVVQVTRVPVWLLKSTRNILKSFQWARDAADRLVRPLC